jgi:lysozyme
MPDTRSILFLAGATFLAVGGVMGLGSAANASIPPESDPDNETPTVPGTNIGPQNSSSVMTGPLTPPGASMGPRAISQAGINYIKKRETLKLTAYPDPPGTGRYSIGYGHNGVPAGTKWTAAQAENMLYQDLNIAERAVNTMVRVPITQGQFDALTDFAYNEGSGTFSRSSVLSYLNAGNYSAAESALARYTTSDGKKLASLSARRSGEQGLWNG